MPGVLFGKPTYKRGVMKTDIAKEKRYLAANVGKAKDLFGVAGQHIQGG